MTNSYMIVKCVILGPLGRNIYLFTSLYIIAISGLKSMVIVGNRLVTVIVYCSLEIVVVKCSLEIVIVH